MVTTLQQASTRPHGYARYQLDGCRCYPCGWAKSVYSERRARLIAYGKWQPWTDVAPVQDHLVTLAALGYGYRTLARLTGLSAKTIRDIRAGARHDAERGHPTLTRVKTATAAAVLAVPLTHQQLPDGALVPAELTWTRIRALVAAGYPRNWIARHAGLGQELQLEPDRITARNARKVEVLYRQIGIRPGPSIRARNEGVRNGWPTPLDLDIDDDDLGLDGGAAEPLAAPPHRPGVRGRRPWQVRFDAALGDAH